MNLRHFDHDGRARFITFVTHRDIPALRYDALKLFVIDSIREIRLRNNLRLLAYVIMPEHVHLVVVPPVEVELGPVIGLAKNRSAHAALRALRSVDPEMLKEFRVLRNGIERNAFWERRCFDHNCRSVNAVRSRIEHCHKNPVKRGLVTSAEEWPWSSCRNYLGWKGSMMEVDTFELQ